MSTHLDGKTSDEAKGKKENVSRKIWKCRAVESRSVMMSCSVDQDILKDAETSARVSGWSGRLMLVVWKILVVRTADSSVKLSCLDCRCGGNVDKG